MLRMFLACMLCAACSVREPTTNVKTGPSTLEVSTRNEYEEVMKAKLRVAKEREPFYSLMVARVHELDVRAGSMREWSEMPNEWETYDYERRELTSRLHALPMNCENAYQANAHDVEVRGQEQGRLFPRAA